MTFKVFYNYNITIVTCLHNTEYAKAEDYNDYLLDQTIEALNKCITYITGD